MQFFIIQSLFILVILQSLEGQEDNPIESFKILLKDFKKKWNEITRKGSNKKILNKDLIPFFKSLGTELGYFHSKKHIHFFYRDKKSFNAKNGS